MSSVVNELSSLQKAIWFEHTHKKSCNFGQLHYTQEKKKHKCVSYNTVLHMFYFNTFTSYVLPNCLEAAPLSQLHVSSIISSLYNSAIVLSSQANQYRSKLVLTTDSLIFSEQFISRSVHKWWTVPLSEMHSNLYKIQFFGRCHTEL